MHSMPARLISHTRRSALIPVATSLLLLLGALGVLAAGNHHLHADLIVFGFLPLFVGGIAVSYAVSGIKSSGTLAKASMILRASSLVLLVVPAAVLIGGRSAGAAALAFSSLLLSVGMLYSATSPRGPSVRLSLLSMSFTYASTAAYAGFLAFRGDVHRPEIIGLLYALPVQAIYSVTIHSMPSTYGERADPRLVALMHGMVGLGLIALVLYPKLGVGVLTASPLLYFLAARVYLTPRRLSEALGMRPGPARSSHLYFLIGHLYVVASWIWLAATTILWMDGRIGSLAVIHALVMGLIGTHIYIHAPLMLPVLLGTSTERRYGHAPFLLLLASMVLWPISGEAAMIFFLLSLAYLLLVVKVKGIPRSLMIPL